MWRTVTFPEFRHAAKRNLKCRVCGKRSCTFMQTQSPFNKTDGRPSTVPEIRAKLRAEAEAWQPDDLCSKCSETEQP